MKKPYVEPDFEIKSVYSAADFLEESPLTPDLGAGDEWDDGGDEWSEWA